MSYAHSPDQRAQCVLIEDVANHAIRLALVKFALMTASDYPTCVLTTVLQQGKTLANLGRSWHIRVMEQQPKNAAHY